MNALATLFLRGFQHGVHPPEHKSWTAELPTQRMPFMARYILPLPDDVDPDQVQAAYRDGVLHVTIKRRESTRPRQITVK